jgi:hypothetical protein
MHDPSEAEHDRVRRGWDWVVAFLLAVAAVPMGLAVKVYELRYKLARAERNRLLGEIPKRRQVAYAAHAVLAIAAFALGWKVMTSALWGIWLYDFCTYYHDRPERMRHLYAVTKTLDELRDFPAPWAWAIPALVVELIRR